MVRDLNFIVLHFKRKWSPVFIYEYYSNRIDFMFIRQYQIQWNKYAVRVLTRFEYIIGYIEPFHHPLILNPFTIH